MIFIEITGWVPSSESLPQPPQQAVETVLEEEGLDTDLATLPARIGPFATFQEADSMGRLIQGYGAEALVVEDPHPAGQRVVPRSVP